MVMECVRPSVSPIREVSSSWIASASRCPPGEDVVSFP